MGWEPATRYHYAPGRSNRVLGTTVAVEWDDHERALMLAHAVVEADRCQGCGGHLSDTTDPDALYTIDPPVRCQKCTMLALARDQLKDHAQPSALYPIVRERT